MNTIQSKKPARQFQVPVIWMLTGLLSWYLSGYLFSYLFSPSLIGVVRKINVMVQSIFLRNIVNILFLRTPEFTLCFIFAVLLSFFTQSTKLRLLLFIIGAMAVSLYVQAESLIIYMRRYSEMPSWSVTWEFLGLMSILLIMPLLSFLGSQVGNYLKLRRTRL